MKFKNKHLLLSSSHHSYFIIE